MGYLDPNCFQNQDLNMFILAEKTGFYALLCSQPEEEAQWIAASEGWYLVVASDTMIYQIQRKKYILT